MSPAPHPALQVGLLLDVLHEMHALALFCSPAEEEEGRRPPAQAEQPLLLALLARLLTPEDGTSQQQQQQAQSLQAVSTLDTPGSRQALVQLVAGLCGLSPDHGQPAAALRDARGPLFSPAAVLQHVVVPAVEWHQGGLAQRGAAGSASAAAAAVQGLHLPLQLAQLLLAGQPAASTAGAGASRTSASPAAHTEAQQHLAPLLPLLRSLLDFEARRVDRSAVALAADSHTFELAASLLRCLDCSAGGYLGAGAYFLSQLQPLLVAQPSAPAAQQQQQLLRQRVQQLRRAMLELLAALLPCCTAAEAREVLHTALPLAIQSALMPGAAPGGGGSGTSPSLPGAHAAAVEATCRAAQMLALQPSQAPIAGEEAPSSPTAAVAAMAPAPSPSALRQAAVERLLQHLTQCCARLAAPAEPSSAALPAPAAAAVAAAGETVPLQLGPAERQALGLRCFRELCQLAAALEPAGYDCGVIQTCLLQLAARQASPEGSPVDAAARQATPAGLLPAQQVHEQLAAAAQALPQGRMREVVLLAVEGGQQ